MNDSHDDNVLFKSVKDKGGGFGTLELLLLNETPADGTHPLQMERSRSGGVQRAEIHWLTNNEFKDVVKHMKSGGSLFDLFNVF